MSGSNYNFSVCQVLESERVLKLSKILKIYNRQSVIRKDRTSFMQFLSTFESEQDTDLPLVLKTLKGRYLNLPLVSSRRIL